MQIRLLIAAATLGGYETLSSGVANACSCDDVAAQFVYPNDGADGIALNAIVVVVASGGEGAAVRVEGDSAGEELEASVEAWPGVIPGLSENWWVLRPRSELTPNTEYEILLDGTTLSRFRTGVSRDDSPSIFAGLEGLGAGVFPGEENESCWVRSRLDQLKLTYELVPADTVYAVLELRREDEAEPFFTLPIIERPDSKVYGSGRLLESSICGPQAPRLDIGTVYCARLIAFDGAGNGSGSDVEACAVAQECEKPATGIVFSPLCEPQSDDEDGCMVTRRGDVGKLGPLLFGALVALYARTRREVRRRRRG